MIRALLNFFTPLPPKRVSRESTDALHADIKAAGVWGEEIGDASRNAVDVWVRHSDRQNRAVNYEWLKPRAKLLALRWAGLSCVLWFGAWIASGSLLAEVPLTLAGFVTGVVAMVLFFIHRAPNK
ncbi:hypothetical protein [Cupriavidus basilensis]|uniref:hypothetical protein n=1 Tax=Cupriavidus basilensis TaxID=68895 RepID=UPI0007509FAD|nr:hypothetical protein [Cupriavidus basilensis]